MRLFIAINIPKAERLRIHRAARPLREQGYPVRWVPEELFHITLKFLGQVSPESLPALRESLGKVAKKTDPFTLEIRGFGAFPTIRRPRVLWVGADPSPALRCLKQDLEWALSDQGFERETREFHPHFTLGRVRTRDGAGAFRGLDVLASELEYEGEAHVGAIELMESHLSSSGARYEILSSFPLSGAHG
jgi:2'-5' RNA ligase